MLNQKLAVRTSTLEHISRPTYIHFLDRESFKCLGAYTSLSESSVFEDLRFLLLSTYEPLYIPITLVFENKFARKIFYQQPLLFEMGHIQLAMRTNSLRDFVFQKRQQYFHAKESYPFYFDETWKFFSRYSPIYRGKDMDTSTVLSTMISSELRTYGTVGSAKRLGVEVDQREIVRLTPYMIEALGLRGNRAITRLLFVKHYEKLRISFDTRRSFDIKVCENYVKANISEYDGTIATGLSSGVDYFNYLCPTFPFHHLPLWRQINHRLGCSALVRSLSAADIVMVRETPEFQSFVDEVRLFITRVIQTRYSLLSTFIAYDTKIIEFLERSLRAHLEPYHCTQTGISGYLYILQRATTMLRSFELNQNTEIKPQNLEQLREKQKHLTAATELSLPIISTASTSLASEKSITPSLFEKLYQSQSSTIEALLDAFKNDRISKNEIEEILIALRQSLTEIRQRGISLTELTELTTDETECLSEVIESPTASMTHNLKITIPIIPFILSYEGYVELKEELKMERLRVLWQRLIFKLRSK